MHGFWLDTWSMVTDWTFIFLEGMSVIFLNGDWAIDLASSYSISSPSIITHAG